MQHRRCCRPSPGHRKFDSTEDLAYKSAIHENIGGGRLREHYTLLELHEEEDQHLLNIGISFGFDEKIDQSALTEVRGSQICY